MWHQVCVCACPALPEGRTAPSAPLPVVLQRGGQYKGIVCNWACVCCMLRAGRVSRTMHGKALHLWTTLQMQATHLTAGHWGDAPRMHATPLHNLHARSSITLASGVCVLRAPAPLASDTTSRSPRPSCVSEHEYTNSQHHQACCAPTTPCALLWWWEERAVRAATLSDVGVGSNASRHHAASMKRCIRHDHVIYCTMRDSGGTLLVLPSACMHAAATGQHEQASTASASGHQFTRMTNLMCPCMQHAGLTTPA